MTEEQVVELGVRAHTLLTSHTFKFVVDHLHEQYTNAILGSKPEERQTRENFYHLHKALSDIVGQLGAYVQAKDGVVKAQEDKEQE